MQQQHNQKRSALSTFESKGKTINIFEWILKRHSSVELVEHSSRQSSENRCYVQNVNFVISWLHIVGQMGKWQCEHCDVRNMHNAHCTFNCWWYLLCTKCALCAYLPFFCIQFAVNFVTFSKLIKIRYFNAWGLRRLLSLMSWFQIFYALFSCVWLIRIKTTTHQHPNENENEDEVNAIYCQVPVIIHCKLWTQSIRATISCLNAENDATLCFSFCCFFFFFLWRLPFCTHQKECVRYSFVTKSILCFCVHRSLLTFYFNFVLVKSDICDAHIALCNVHVNKFFFSSVI